MGKKNTRCEKNKRERLCPSGEFEKNILKIIP